MTRSASEPSRVCPASAKVAAAAWPVLGFPGDRTGLIIILSIDLISASSFGVEGSPSDEVSWAVVAAT